VAKFSDTESCADQAASWIARLRSDQVTEQDEQAFVLWLAESPEHQIAFDEMLLLWEAMGSAPVSANATTNDSVARKTNGTIHTLPVRKQADSSQDRPQTASQPVPTPSGIRANTQQVNELPVDEQWEPKPSFWSNTGFLSAVAASIVVAAVVLLTPNKPTPVTQAALITYETGIGQQKSWKLQDGSIIELNTASEVRVRYRENARELRRVEGEAFFDVESDKQRPLTVAAGSGQITAVGTAFNINLDGQFTRVTVTEGTVEILARDNTNTDNANTDIANTDVEPVLASEGQQVEVEGYRVFNLPDTDTNQATAWRRKTLIFNDQELTVALTELNRYLIHPVDVSDPSLKGLRISGTFSLEDPETTLDAIIKTFQLATASFDNGAKLRRLIR